MCDGARTSAKRSLIVLWACAAWAVGPGPARALAEEPHITGGTIRAQPGVSPESLATVTEEQAREAALDAVDEATFDSIELEVEDGFVVYEVELRVEGREVEVVVDAGDATVLQISGDDEGGSGPR